MSDPVFLCPICGQRLAPVGFCHLVCPTGHYQEVCSDLFEPDYLDTVNKREPRDNRQVSEPPHKTPRVKERDL